VSKRRVVVTGLGVVCPLGSTVTDAWAAVLRGESGIAPITAFDTTGFATTFGGAVRGFDLASYITPKEAVIYGLVHAVKDFMLPEGYKIIQI